MEQQDLNSEASLKKLTDLVEEVKVCMFATVHQDYSVFSRPMQSITVDKQGNIWFFTNEFSEKVDDVSHQNTVYLMYSHPGNNTYLHIKGKCTVVNDQAKIKEMWSPIVKAWFPKGVEDPALSLLQVEVTEASYWNGESSKFVIFYNIIKAIAKGEKHNDGEFGRLNINS
jgi:general stress protein 26